MANPLAGPDESTRPLSRCAVSGSYLYQAVDQATQTADLRLSKKVDAEEPYSAHQKNIAPALMVILGIRWLL
jgi:hypothetical protein